MAFPALLTLIALVACLAGLTWLWIAVARRPDATARCGRCSYAVEGLETMSCPECGGDFRQVGITTARSRRPHPALFVVAWTLLLPIPALTVSVLAVQAIPRTRQATAVMAVRPLSGSFSQVDLFFELEDTRAALSRGVSSSSSTRTSVQRGVDGRTTTTTTTFTLPTVAATGRALRVAELRFPTTPGQVTSVPPGQPPTGPALALPMDPEAPIDEAALARWLEARDAAGSATGPPGGAEGSAGGSAGGSDKEAFEGDVAELTRLVRAIVAGQASFTTTRLTSAGTATMSGAARLPWWVVPTILAFWTLVWLGGLVLFARLRRRDRAAASSRGTPAVASASASASPSR